MMGDFDLDAASPPMRYFVYAISTVFLIGIAAATFYAFWTGEWRYLIVPGVFYAMTRY